MRPRKSPERLRPARRPSQAIRRALARARAHRRRRSRNRRSRALAARRATPECRSRPNARDGACVARTLADRSHTASTKKTLSGASSESSSATISPRSVAPSPASMTIVASAGNSSSRSSFSTRTTCSYRCSTSSAISSARSAEAEDRHDLFGVRLGGRLGVRRRRGDRPSHSGNRRSRRRSCARAAPARPSSLQCDRCKALELRSRVDRLARRKVDVETDKIHQLERTHAKARCRARARRALRPMRRLARARATPAGSMGGRRG